MSSSSPAWQGLGDPAAAPVEGSVDPAAGPVRRSFTEEYRARVVAEYEAAPHGLKASVLRREGLYQSQVQKWTVARDALVDSAGAPPLPRRPHRARESGGKDDPVRLRAENERLARELARSQAVVEVMGKLHGLLETISESTDTPGPSVRR